MESGELSDDHNVILVEYIVVFDGCVDHVGRVATVKCGMETRPVSGNGHTEKHSMNVMRR